MVLEKTLESLLDCKEIQPVHSKGDQPWVFFGRTNAKAETLATSCEELTHWKRPWCWEELGAGGEGDDRGWDGWMVSPTRWTWVWVNTGSWWWTGRPSVLQFMGLQRVGHDWVTELNWAEGASLVAQTVKNPPAMQETRVRSLGWEDLLEKGKAAHSSILAYRIPWIIQSMGSQRVGHNWRTFDFTFKRYPLNQE